MRRLVVDSTYARTGRDGSRTPRRRCALNEGATEEAQAMARNRRLYGRKGGLGRDSTFLRRSSMKPSGRSKLYQASMYECSRCGDEYTFAAGDDEMLFTIHRLLHLAADWRFDGGRATAGQAGRTGAGWHRIGATSGRGCEGRRALHYMRVRRWRIIVL